jgi:crotonobetainyl-CoA:carnitine CoA-transferase CaiB-like acyl-CoA transferase
VFKTRDGHINIAASGGAIWERLCRAIGAEVLLDDPRYATADARSKNRDALNAAIEKHLADGTCAEWVERLNAAGVPSGPINSIDKVFADPQVEHLGLVQEIETGDARGRLRVVSQPVTLGRTPSRLVAAPPECGQHTEEVLAEFGFSAEEIAALRKASAI